MDKFFIIFYIIFIDVGSNQFQNIISLSVDTTTLLPSFFIIISGNTHFLKVLGIKVSNPASTILLFLYLLTLLT